VERWRFGRLTSEEQQTRLRSRTVESIDSKNVDNPSRTSVIESHVSEPEATSTTTNLELTNLSLNSKKSSSRSFGSRKLKKKIGRRKKKQRQPDQSTLNSLTQKSRKESINRLAMRQKQMNWKTNELMVDPLKTDQVEHRSIEIDESSGNLYYYDSVANISTWFTEEETEKYRSSNRNWKTNELMVDPLKTDQVDHRSIEIDESSGNLYYYDSVANISTWFTEEETEKYRVDNDHELVSILYQGGSESDETSNYTNPMQDK